MKYFLPVFLLVLSLLPAAAPAQIRGATWVRGFPLTTATAYPPKMVSDGLTFFVAGSFTQSITLAPGTTLTSQGGLDGYLAEYDTNGALKRVYQLSGPDDNYIQGITYSGGGPVKLLVVTSGGVSFGALGFGTVSYTPSNTGTTLLCVNVYNYFTPYVGIDKLAYGATIMPTGFAMSYDNRPIISGYFTGSITIGSTVLTAPVTSTGYALDQFIALTSCSGFNCTWAKQGGRVQVPTGGYTPLFPSHLATLNSYTDIYFNWTCDGNAGGFGSVALPPGLGDYDALVLKITIQGNIVWAKRLGGSGADVVNAALVPYASNPNLLVAGYTAPAGHFAAPTTFTASTPATGFLTQVELTAGAEQWTQQLGATTAGSFQNLVVPIGANPDLFAVGSFAGQGALGGTSFTSAGGIDALVACFTQAGALRWTRQSAGTGDEFATGIGLAYYALTLTGTYAGQASFGPSTFTATPANGLSLPFMAQLASPLAAQPAAAALPLACYPNPAASNGYLTLPSLPAGTHLTLLDATGRTVRRQLAAPTLPLAGLAPGLYQVQATAPAGVQWSSRLLVE